MHLWTTLLGVAAILFSCASIYFRFKDPSKLGKLEAMKEFWGEGLGTLIHVVAYTVVPAVFGVATLLMGLRGESIF